MFSVRHIITMVLCIGLIVGLFYLTKKWEFKKKIKYAMIVGILSEIVKILFYIVANEDKYGGYLPKNDLPFQLCSIQILLLCILNYSKNEGLNRSILSFMLPCSLIGGSAAILIPTSSSLTTVVIGLQYNIFHSVIIVFALHILTSKELNLTIKDYFSCLKMILVVMFFAIYINSICYDGNQTVNFMYVVNPPVSGLPILNKNHGWLVYFISYGIIVLTAITLCYIKPIINAVKEKINNKNNVSTNNKDNN